MVTIKDMKNFESSSGKKSRAKSFSFAVPKKESQPRYNFKKMIRYCEENGKDITRLTTEEKSMFLM